MFIMNNTRIFYVSPQEFVIIVFDYIFDVSLKWNFNTINMMKIAPISNNHRHGQVRVDEFIVRKVYFKTQLAFFDRGQQFQMRVFRCSKMVI